MLSDSGLATNDKKKTYHILIDVNNQSSSVNW